MADALVSAWRAARRSPVFPVVLVVGVLAISFTNVSSMGFGGLKGVGLEVVLLAGVATGWVVGHQLANRRHVSAVVALALVVAAFGAWAIVHGLVRAEPARAASVVELGIGALVWGGLLRGLRPGPRSPAALVAIASVTTWLTYDAALLPFRPLRDLHTYLQAGAATLGGHSPYLQGPMSNGLNPNPQPFVYPPVTLPLFELLTRLPAGVVQAVWTISGIAAIVIGLWQLGVRGRWLVLLLAWPAFSLGVAVGNVAVFGFLLFALTYRVGAAVVQGAAFKPQFLVPALWLIRERRWQSLIFGVFMVAAAALIALLMTHAGLWIEFLRSLGYYQTSTDRFPAMKGFSLTRWLPVFAFITISAGAVVIALLGRGRNGLARLGLASVVASPTLYLHGLTVLLPGVLALPPDMLWFVLALGPWIGSGVSAWIGVVIVAVALIARPADDLSIIQVPGSGSDLHPAGSVRTVWP
jgi:Glycosyltransferase family 87